MVRSKETKTVNITYNLCSRVNPFWRFPLYCVQYIRIG